jgi:CRP/FNR family transcriptional regulator
LTRILEFPALPGVTADLRRELVRLSRQVRVPQGSEVFAPGAHVDALLILLSGTLRVEQLAGPRRDIVLFRAHGGEGCILTAACLLADTTHAATGIAETDLVLMSVSRAAFDDLLVRSPEFRGLILKSTSRRIMHLMQVLEEVEEVEEVREVAFRRIDVRLSGRLIDLAGDRTRVIATRQQIARELGTARKVVSRQLGEFERRGWVEVGRGIVRLLDKEALRKLANSDRTALA